MWLGLRLSLNSWRTALLPSPIYIWEYDEARYVYGFPALGPGVKLAYHHAGLTTTPETLLREVAPEEIQAIHRIGQRLLPQLSNELVASTVCMYTTTPDHHFYIGTHPRSSRVTIASPCSGHGFKFSCVIGEILSDLVTDRGSAFDLELFNPSRPAVAGKQASPKN
ncbi:MAG TPA: FAD-dependent oxidoreductase [Verrucomicrobiae bacterium]|nr:FAD-dependent oxidoreductase [Verrucomicrobiae bacterium]